MPCVSGEYSYILKALKQGICVLDCWLYYDLCLTIFNANAGRFIARTSGACGSDHKCKSLVRTSCSPHKVETGGYCSKDCDCKSGDCNSSTHKCRPSCDYDVADGGSCSKDCDCKSGDCSSSSHKCKPSSCGHHDDCGDDEYCYRRHCYSQKGKGKECWKDYECLSHHCDCFLFVLHCECTHP